MIATTQIQCCAFCARSDAVLTRTITNSGPLKEAAFLARASALRFAVAHARDESEFRGMSTLGGSVTEGSSKGESKSNDYRLRYQFVAPGRPWIGVVSYNHGNSTSDDLGILRQTQDERRNSYSVGMGRYVGHRTAVIAEYGRSHRDTDWRPAIDSWAGLQSVRHETLTLGVHSLLKLGTRRHLGLAAALHETAATGANVSDDSIGSYEVGVTYYPRNDVSIGLSVTGEYTSNTWGGDRRGYMLEANWFVSESIALGLGYDTSESRNGFTDSFGFSSAGKYDSEGFRLSASWRR